MIDENAFYVIQTIKRYGCWIMIPKQEFSFRAKKIRELLEKSKMDGAFFWGDEFYSGYVRYLSDYTPLLEYSAVLIPVKEDPILLAGPECEDLAKSMSKIDDIRIASELAIPGEEYPHSKTITIERLISEVFGAGKTITLGVVELGSMPVFLRRAVEKGKNKLIDFTKPVEEMRAIKSENEIALMKKAYEIASEGLDFGIEAVKPGKKECEVAGEVARTIWNAGAEVSHLFMVASGKRLAGMTVLNRPSDKIIEDGELVVIDIGAVCDGYYSDNGRTLIAGKSRPKESVRAVNVATEVQEKIIDAMKPGVKGYEVDRVAREAVEKLGFGKNLIAGPVHGVGLAHCEKPMCGPTSDVVLKEGMTFAVDMGLWNLPYGGVRIEDGVVVTKKGVEVLTKTKKIRYTVNA